MWSALGIISILHGKRQRAHWAAGDTIIPSHGGRVVSPWLGVWSRSLNEPPYGRWVQPLHISFPAVPTPLKLGQETVRTTPPQLAGVVVVVVGAWKWRAFHKGELEKFKFRGTADKRDRLRKTHRRKRTIQMERNDKEEGEGGRDANREKEEWWWEKERVKGRKWGERKWRGQVQQQSRWEEGKSDGVARSERVEKLMSLLLFDGACPRQRQDAFLTFSFRDPVLFPVFSLYFFSVLSFLFLSPFLAFSLFQTHLNSLARLYVWTAFQKCRV